MITNTELYYTKMKGFQDKRAELTEAHEAKMKKLEPFKGSKAYDEELKKENELFGAEMTALQEKYRPELQTVFGGMIDAIGRRSVSAPTTDQVNLLNVLKMKKKVTLEECQRTAEAVKNNPIAVSLVTEIAHDHGIMQGFDHLCPEMSSQRASDIVTSLKTETEDFLQFDTTRASRLAKRYHDVHYGETEGGLKKRRLFTNQDEFFRSIGLEGETLRQFSEIVDKGCQDD